VNLFKITTMIAATALLSLSGCKKEEDQAAQIPPPPVMPPMPADPELQPIQAVGAQGSGQFSVGKANPTGAGNYVIQVDIKPTQKAADKVLEKLRSSGIEAYVSQVENPGELEGSYFRVRIGFFASIAEATNYAKGSLAPLGYAWWVDNKKNDTVGNSAPSSASEDNSTPPTASDWNQPAAQTPTPEPTPAPAVAPAPATPAPSTPAPAPATPAPQKPAPAPAAADDEWQ
jgi:hypothetical protein